jgi:hypothetical protein
MTITKPYKNGDHRLVLPTDAPITAPPRSGGQIVLRPTVELSFWLRTWRFFRKLIRQRQESKTIREIRLKAAADRRDAAKQYANLEEVLKRRDNTIKELEGRLAGKDRTIGHLENTDVPKLKDRIEVLEAELSLWVAVHERNLTREKAEIAVHNERIVPRDDALAWRNRMEGIG